MKLLNSSCFVYYKYSGNFHSAQDGNRKRHGGKGPVFDTIGAASCDFRKSGLPAVPFCDYRVVRPAVLRKSCRRTDVRDAGGVKNENPQP
ncbi:hypothetical protein [uncultured Alistipes sp.]|uniref:hypothetical protein n=1 Tax=uncultured Alistipes sp. TaxID=538949 RepID=UPI0026658875|nr:hypothetical protein [uncultured Alistipes sp.]